MSTIDELVKKITEMLQNCHDMETLDFIFKLLKKTV